MAIDADKVTRQVIEFNNSLSVMCIVLVGLSLGFLSFCYPEGLIFFGFFLVVMLVLTRPEYSYFLIIASMSIHSLFFQPGKDHHKAIYFVEIFVLCAMCSWIIRRLVRLRDPYPGTSCDWFFAVFCGWAALSLLWTTDLYQGYFEIFRLFVCIAAFILTVALIQDEKMLRFVFYIFISIGILQAILCVVSVYSTMGLKERYSFYDPIGFYNYIWARHTMSWLGGGEVGGRGEGFAVPHTVAAFLNLPIIFGIGFFMVTESMRKRSLWLVVVIVMMAGNFSTLTKSTIVSLWVGLTFLLVHLRPLKKWLVTCLFIILAASIALSTLVHIGNLGGSLEYTERQLKAESGGSSVGSRLTWWKRGMEKLIDTNGVGYGAGGFIKTVPYPVPDGAHPAVLFDFGILGLLFWVLIYASSFLTFYTHLKNCNNEYYRRLLLAYLAGYVTMVISWIVTLHYDRIDLFLYLGLGYALVRISASHALDKPKLPFYTNEETLIKLPFGRQET